MTIPPSLDSPGVYLPEIWRYDLATGISWHIDKTSERSLLAQMVVVNSNVAFPALVAFRKTVAHRLFNTNILWRPEQSFRGYFAPRNPVTSDVYVMIMDSKQWLAVSVKEELAQVVIEAAGATEIITGNFPGGFKYLLP